MTRVFLRSVCRRISLEAQSPPVFRVAVRRCLCSATICLSQSFMVTRTVSISRSVSVQILPYGYWAAPAEFWAPLSSAWTSLAGSPSTWARAYTCTALTSAAASLGTCGCSAFFSSSYACAAGRKAASLGFLIPRTPTSGASRSFASSATYLSAMSSVLKLAFPCSDANFIESFGPITHEPIL